MAEAQASASRGMHCSINTENAFTLIHHYNLRCSFVQHICIEMSLITTEFICEIVIFNFKIFSMQNFYCWAFAVVCEGNWLSSKPLWNFIKLAPSVAWCNAQLLTDCLKVSISFLTSFMVCGITHCCSVFIHLAVELIHEWRFPWMILCMFSWKLKYS